MGSLEWPLVLFTVLSQISVGIILVLFWLDQHELKESLFKRGVLVSGTFLVAALLASLFHLGHPEAAYRAITHLSSSWLSREIVMFLLTFAGWLFLLWIVYHPGSNRRTPLLITSILGLLGTLSSAMIYVLPRVPAWNNAAPLVFFFITAVLMGPLVTAILGYKEIAQAQRKSLLHWSIGCLLASIVLFVLYASFIQVNNEGAATVQAYLSSPFFWIRVVIGWLVPLLFLVSPLKTKKALSPNLLLMVVVFTGFGELIGRSLFYFAAAGIHITALF
ncbi:dimethyl sulfoxide reductase anchor subunit family protein [Desulfitobacterium sp. Sab5]|uniref:dimethyl sulfoxide reductase anchor subunit family protein n=1 Tax=Desulfitobacterium nosdiversum TaxID=3375356 RepID=UPI003CFA4C88